MTDVTPTGAGSPGTSDDAGDGLAGGAMPGGSVPPGDSVLPEDAGLAAERERLARQLRDTRMQLAMTEARLSALQGSAKMRFGTMLANAAHRPWPRGVQLPRELYKLWRERGLKPTAAQHAATALASAQLTDLAGTGERFLSALTTPGALLRHSDPALTLTGGVEESAVRGPVITGALSALGCATLSPDAVVHPLLPHDADVVLEGTGADLVVIEAAALLPGSPWAYATDPAAADRGRRLARMIVMARSLGKPVVLVRNVPHSLLPGLGWLVPACDAVLDTDLGVQLARFNPIGVSADRPADPVYAGDRDPREAPAVRALLDALTGPGADTVSGSQGGDAASGSRGGGAAAVTLAGARSWRGLPALYGSHAVFVAAHDAQLHAQQACGARVVALHGAAGVAPLTAEAVREELAAARAAGPPPAAEVRAGLRDVFASHSTPVRLSGLLRAVGLSAAVATGREVSVLARVADAAAARRLAAGLEAQRLRPAEVIVGAAPTASGAVREALSGLADKGVRIVVTDFAGGGADAAPGTGAEWARPLARQAETPWVAPWPADVLTGANAGAGQAGGAAIPDTYLLDLVCARECAQADAIGFGPADYEFTLSLAEPALARRDLLAPNGPGAADWGSHGLRLFTVTRA
jgi:hypothetical protein